MTTVDVIRPGTVVRINGGTIEARILNVILGEQDFMGAPMPLYQCIWWSEGNRVTADLHPFEITFPASPRIARIGFATPPEPPA